MVPFWRADCELVTPYGGLPRCSHGYHRSLADIANHLTVMQVILISNLRYNNHHLIEFVFQDLDEKKPTFDTSDNAVSFTIR